jgi:DNA-binding transcriptional ArsR family regulator
MPQIVTDTPPRPGPNLVVEASVAIELEWALGSGGRPDYRADNAVLADVYARHPDLLERVCAQWGPEEAMSCFGFFELLVLAHRGGLLFTTDADALIGRLEALCAMDPVDPADYPFRSESAEDAAAILRRLVLLRESPARRRAYVSLVRDVWDALREPWTVWGLPAVEAAIAARRGLQSSGHDWREVARGGCDFGPLLEETVAALDPDGEVVVVPAFFTHRGLFVDLPGVVAIGVRTDTTGAEARARTESLARRLKAISDPTRLAMVDALRRRPGTVTELASSFALAQPTVSNHVKVLRQAGLVADERDGTRRTLTVRHEAVEELLATLNDVLAGRAGYEPVGGLPGG